MCSQYSGTEIVETFRFTESIEQNDELLTIIETLKSIKPQVEAVAASRQNEVVTSNEPANKLVQQQRRFSKTSKLRKCKAAMSKPDLLFTRNLTLAALHSLHPFDPLTSQTLIPPHLFSQLAPRNLFSQLVPPYLFSFLSPLS